MKTVINLPKDTKLGGILMIDGCAIKLNEKTGKYIEEQNQLILKLISENTQLKLEIFKLKHRRKFLFF